MQGLQSPSPSDPMQGSQVPWILDAPIPRRAVNRGSPVKSIHSIPGTRVPQIH